MNNPIDATTWNPVTGCTRVSDGCSNCYIWSIPSGAKTVSPVVADDQLLKPLGWQKPRYFRVCDTGDLFHTRVPTAVIHRVFAVMAIADQHTFAVCTKRPGRARKVLSDPGFAAGVHAAALELQVDGIPVPDVTAPLPNVWIGTSVENSTWAARRVPELLLTPAAKRFVVCEPLLGPVSLAPWLSGDVDWIIIGGERGSAARLTEPEWVRALAAEAHEARVPVWFRGWGQNAYTAQLPAHTAHQVRYRATRARKPVPSLYRGAPVRTGDLLDGRQYHEHPGRGQ